MLGRVCDRVRNQTIFYVYYRLYCGKSDRVEGCRQVGSGWFSQRVAMVVMVVMGTKVEKALMAGTALTVGRMIWLDHGEEARSENVDSVSRGRHLRNRGK